VLSAFTRLVTTLSNIVLIPFGDNRVLGLCGSSFLAGIAMIFIFKATSDQQGVKAARDQFKARILEMRIYQDDIVLILKALGAAIWTNVTYLRVSLKPILVLVAFALLVFIQLDQRYGRAPLDSGETAMLTVTLKPGVDALSVPTELQVGEGIAVDARPVRVTSRHEVNWRLRVTAPGRHNVTLTAYDKAYEFPIFADVSNDAIGRKRTANSWTDALIHTGLPALPANSPIESVELRYPTTDYSLFGWHTHWIIVFIVLSFLGATIPKFLFGIEV